ncbi:class D beta-lactamase [Pseudalkalibacillus berkeleyi]|uniref:Beta-lactamase n=1 Tax=Pseudalkalibacillus berkeleyi TaxID=1069813 RepID=A0ABS9GY65_9BACL|nr:class D beta-lactamase [Pseudalkalibacillus berkeleyi]MCF6136574.1 class D beta-lactamase [Pseudalkalibacillus berkeleyi]
MKKMIWFIVTFFLISILSTTPQTNAKTSTNGDQKTKEIDLSHFFSHHDGTFILKKLNNNKMYVYNSERADTLFTPESTFKVPNALIGLEVGAVRDEYDVKRWDGIERQFEIWNEDHTLGSGMRYSVIWYYQAMARDIGNENMQTWISNLSYGNEDISGGIDQFWLNSSLELTPFQQADFMEQLYKEELPFTKKNMKTVKRMMIQKDEDNYVVYGKTGTRLSDFGLGWFVGFVENKQGAYVFVTNINASGTTASNITYEILKEMKIIQD